MVVGKDRRSTSSTSGWARHSPTRRPVCTIPATPAPPHTQHVTQQFEAMQSLRRARALRRGRCARRHWASVLSSEMRRGRMTLGVVVYICLVQPRQVKWTKARAFGARITLKYTMSLVQGWRYLYVAAFPSCNRSPISIISRNTSSHLDPSLPTHAPVTTMLRLASVLALALGASSSGVQVRCVLFLFGLCLPGVLAF